jgi:hypothetical protein
MGQGTHRMQPYLPETHLSIIILHVKIIAHTYAYLKILHVETWLSVREETKCSKTP